MTFAPRTLLDLAALWTGDGGASLGITGDAGHVLAGTSYHLGRDQLKAGAYSAQLARDRAGLSNAASAIDFGQLGGSYARLQHFSRWLVAAVRSDPTKYRDIREVIYSPDGISVYRWDNNARALYRGGTGTGQGDDSHKRHTHVSMFRDSEFRDKRPLIASYFALGGGAAGQEATMLPFIDARAREVDLRAGTVLYDESGKAVRTLTAPATVVAPFISSSTYTAVFARIDGRDVLARARSADVVGPRRLPNEVEALIAAAKEAGIAEGVASVVPPPDTSPYTPADLTAARGEGYAEARSKAIAAVQAI